MMQFKDFYGNKLRNGIYFAGNGREGDFYFIQITDNSKKFSAESREGSVSIKNFELFAKQLIPLANPRHNLEFAVSRNFLITKT